MCMYSNELFCLLVYLCIKFPNHLLYIPGKNTSPASKDSHAIAMTGGCSITHRVASSSTSCCISGSWISLPLPLSRSLTLSLAIARLICCSMVAFLRILVVIVVVQQCTLSLTCRAISFSMVAHRLECMDMSHRARE